MLYSWKAVLSWRNGLISIGGSFLMYFTVCTISVPPMFVPYLYSISVSGLACILAFGLSAVRTVNYLRPSATKLHRSIDITWRCVALRLNLELPPGETRGFYLPSRGRQRE